MAYKKTRLMTLEDRRREQSHQLDRGKKLLAGCLVGAAMILYGWNAQDGFFSLTFACVLLAAALVAQLQQVPLGRFFRLLLTVGFAAAGAWFAVRGILEILL